MRKIFTKTALVLFFSIGISAIIYAQTTITLQPGAADGKDAILHSLPSHANQSLGDNNQFPAGAQTAGGDPFVEKSVVEFDLSGIPTGTIINSATLSLYAWGENSGQGPHNTLSGTNECWLERITESWDEHTVTWNNQPASTATNRITVPESSSPDQDYPNIDVTTLIQDILDNPTTSFGLIMRPKIETHWRQLNFCSSDHADPALHPKLVICYNNSSSITETTGNDVGFIVYPNPASSAISVEIDNDHPEDHTIEIINPIGMKINIINNPDHFETIDISNYSKGLYFIRLIEGSKVWTKKLVIK